MKLTLELGMLIICVVLLMLLVASQYTKQSKCNDVEEGFSRINMNVLPVMNNWDDLSDDDKYFLSSSTSALKNIPRLRKIMSQFKVNISNHNHKLNYCRLMASFGQCNRNDCDQIECEKMFNERQNMVDDMQSAKIITSKEYDTISPDNKNEIYRIVKRMRGGFASKNNYANYCYLRARTGNCTNWCKDDECSRYLHKVKIPKRKMTNIEKK